MTTSRKHPVTKDEELESEAPKSQQTELVLPPKKRFMSLYQHQPVATQPGPSSAPEVSTTITSKTEQEDDDDMVMSDNDKPGVSKPTVLWLNPSVYVTATKPSSATKNPLRVALEQHFSLMNKNGLKPFHYSEILRCIALYHRQHRSSIMKGQEDLFAVILFLHEKAVILEPRNENATSQLDSYRQHVVQDINAQPVREERNHRYAEECKKMGPVAFFWMSLDKYLERLKTIYSESDYNREMAAVCKFLNGSEVLISMRKKHISGDEQVIASFRSFVSAAMAFEQYQQTFQLKQ